MLLLGATACAPGAPVPPADPPALPSPESELRAGARALESDDFDRAARHLGPLSGGCLDDDVQVRAALLAVAAELDPANPRRSVDTATTLAARILRSTPHGDPAFAHARALYRLALDQGGTAADPPTGVASCESERIHVEPLPELFGPGTAARLSTLADSVKASSDSLAARSAALAAQADSLERARARVRAAEQQINSLEEELRRIRELLRGGPEPTP